VLDCFSYTGAFAVHAAGYGAARVTAVDISASALEQARRNAALNGFDDRVQLVEANVFDYLREKASSPEARGSYDMVILDPPAFTKTRHATESALRGYKEINLRAAHLLADGGILVTSSCSHHVDDYTFVQVVESALKDAGRRARVLEHRGQGRDHPVLAGVPETSYLKFLVLQMV
ncbi:MAG: class I SAM-dependent methyltransferase, partial [Bacillota bacterium]